MRRFKRVQRCAVIASQPLSLSLLGLPGIPRVLQAASSYDVLSRAAPSSSTVARDASSGPCACSSSSCAASSSTRRAPGRGSSVAAARDAAASPARAARGARVVLRQRTIELHTAAAPALRARRGPRQARTAKRYSKAAAPARLMRARAVTACSRGQRAAPWRGVLLDSLALMLAAAKARQGIVVRRTWRAWCLQVAGRSRVVKQLSCAAPARL